MWDKASGIFSLLSMIVLLCLVLALAYFATRFIGRRYAPASSGNLRVVDRIMLGQDRYLVIVEAAGQTLLLGVTPHHVERICELDPASLNSPTVSEPDFAKTLRELLGSTKGKEKGGEESADR